MSGKLRIAWASFTTKAGFWTPVFAGVTADFHAFVVSPGAWVFPVDFLGTGKS